MRLTRLCAPGKRVPADLHASGPSGHMCFPNPPCWFLVLNREVWSPTRPLLTPSPSPLLPPPLPRYPRPFRYPLPPPSPPPSSCPLGGCEVCNCCHVRGLLGGPAEWGGKGIPSRARGSLGGCEVCNRRHFRGLLGGPAEWGGKGIPSRARGSLGGCAKCATVAGFVASWGVSGEGW